MRVVWSVLLPLVVVTACSSDPVEIDARSGDAVIDQEAVVAARTVGEPGEMAAEHIDALDSEALAFEQPDTSPDEPASNSVPSGNDLAAESDNSDQDLALPEESTELSRLLDELIIFVEQERGHHFDTRPAVTLLDNDGFNEAWNALISGDAQEFATDYDNFTDIYRAMGIIEGSATLEEIWKRFGDAGVLGYYDPDRGDIVLRAGEITAFTKTVLVHELVHALDDQIFGIDRDEYAERDDEISWTFSALVEGSAGVIEQRYRATLSAAERDEEIAVQRALPRGVSLSEFTDSFLELQFGRYRYGDAFAEALWAVGRAEVDRAFEEPPATSEVVIDPGAYLSGAPINGAIAPPQADGEVFESGVWGEAAWAALFADAYGVAEGRALADGWGGDQFVAWRTGSQTCVRIHVEADTPGDLDNYAIALQEWSRQAVGRDVFYPTAELVRVTGCR